MSKLLCKRLRLAIALCILLTAAACSNGSGLSEAGPVATPMIAEVTQRSSNIGSEFDCSDPPVSSQLNCYEVRVRDRSYRYGLFNPVDSPVSLLLADFGGPGIATMSVDLPNLSLATISSTWNNNEMSLIVLEEPWVTREVEPRCRVAGREYVSYVLDHTEIQPALASECSLGYGTYGWDSNDYAEVLREVEIEQAASVRAVIGTSYAGTRLSYLQGKPFDSVILSSPLFTGMTTTEIVAHQLVRIEEVFNQLVQSGHDPNLELAAAAYGLLEIENVPALDPEEVREVAAKAIGAYGTGDLSISRLAFFDEFCKSGGAIDPLELDGNEVVVDFLVRLYSPCNGIAASELKRPDLSNACIAVDRDDVVIPAGSQLLSESAETINLQMTHASIEGWRACVEAG